MRRFSMRSFSISRADSKALEWKNKGATQEVQWAQTNDEYEVDYVPDLEKEAVGGSIM